MSGAWVTLAILGLTALYGLHRLALMMESKGWIYYTRTSPKGRSGGGMAGSLVAFQKIIEPQSGHVLEVREQTPRRGDEGAGDPPPIVPRPPQG